MEQLNAEEQEFDQLKEEEDRKRKEVMKKFYRNRYSSFLNDLKTKKAEEEKA